MVQRALPSFNFYIGVSHPLGKHAQGNNSRISNVFGYIMVSSQLTSVSKVSLKQILQFPQAQNMFRKQISRLCFLETHLFLCHGFTSGYAAPLSFSSPVLLVLKCRWRLALDIKSLRCFSLPRNENYKALCIPVYFRRRWPHFVGALYEKKTKQLATIPDRSERISA